MAIQNINSLNNPSEFNLTEATEQYLIQALANLGQRYSIQGDGIGIRTIRFSDLFTGLFDDINIDMSVYNSSSYIGCVSYGNDNKVSFTIVDKNLTPVSSGSTPIAFDEDNFNYVVSLGDADNNFTMAVNETGLTKCANTCIYSDEHYMVFSMGEYAGNDEALTRYTCQKYDKYSGDLVSGFRIMPTGNEDTEHGFNNTVIYVQKAGKAANGTNYHVSIYDVKLDSNVYLDSGQDAARFTIEDISSKFVRTHGLNDAGDGVNYGFTPESVLSQIYTALKTVNASDRFKQVLYSGNAEDPHTLVLKNGGSFDIPQDDSALRKYIDFINYFTYDKTYIFRGVKQYYSQVKFMGDADSKSLLNKVLSGLLDLVYEPDNKQKEIYVPLDYAFEYAYNTNDPWQVYFSTHDIGVRFAKLSNMPTKAGLVFSLNDPAALVCTTTKDERMAFYNFSVEYEPESDNIYGVNVEKHSELPYINEYGYWVINGVSTEIFARGKDAGNPNIVIVESTAGSEVPNIITMADKDYFSSIPWVRKKVLIKLPEKYVKVGPEISIVDPVGSDLEGFFDVITAPTASTPGRYAVECSFLVPSLNSLDKKRLEEHIEKLKYSIILNLATLDSVTHYGEDVENGEAFKETVDLMFGENGRLSSIWTLEEDNEPLSTGYSFQPRLTDEGYAVDFNYMSNMDNVVGWAISNYIPSDPDNFMFSHIVFDKVCKTAKNQDYDRGDPSVYPVIRNKTSDEYRNSQYTNQYNIAIEFLDTVSTLDYDPANSSNGSNTASTAYIISELSQTDTRRYFDEWVGSDIGTRVTNIYGEDYKEYLPNDADYSIPVLDTAEVFVKDFNAMNRVNVVSFSEDTSYYSYIGTMYDAKADKSVFVIGTSNTDINIGTGTMTSEVGANAVLNLQRQININFDNTRISAYAYIGNDIVFERDTISYGTNWHRHDIGETAYWSCDYTPCGKFSSHHMTLAQLPSSGNTGVTIVDDSTCMFVKCYVDERYVISNVALIDTDEPADPNKGPATEPTEPEPMCIGDAVNIKCLLGKVVPQVDLSTQQIQIFSANDIIKNNGEQIAVMLSTNNDVDNKFPFDSPMLSISYYIDGDIMRMTIDENNKHNTIRPARKIQTDYSISEN